MSTISQVQSRLSSININQIAAESIEECTDVIVREQQNQLKYGLRADGAKIGKYKNKKYAIMKAAQNPLPGFGNVDLILKGDFKNEVFLDVRDTTMVLDSADSKTQKLFDQYGDPMGLTKESRVIVINEKLRNTFKNNVQKATSL